MKRLTTKEFIERSTNVHNGKYDYSKVVYKTLSTRVCIICPIHGEFWQLPHNHLFGKGCKDCQRENLKKIIYGKYVNDYQGKIWDNDKKQMIQSYIIWRAMIMRCEDKAYKEKYPTYEDCYICTEWQSFSNFKEWFDKHYVEGWALDKDIIVKGNKVYSPDTCCFVPVEINSAFTTNKKNRGDCLIGASRFGDRFISTNHHHYLGIADTQEEIFAKYKEYKESRLKELADKYKTQLEPRAYNAICNYKIEMTD